MRGCGGGWVADRPLRVVQVNATGDGGGAAFVAAQLHRGLPPARVRSTFLAGRAPADAQDVIELQLGASAGAWLRLWSRLERALRSAPWAARACRALGAPSALVERLRGHEDFHHPVSRTLLELASPAPHVLHLHNLHGDYFDLELLPVLSRAVPTVTTLHDAWLLSGHCAHSLECDRWRTGCGACPDLRIYPALLRDGTAFNWKRKQRILAGSRLRIATPCAWLMRRVEQSLVAAGMVEGRVIPHGVDLALFRPGSRAEARRALGLPLEAEILTCAGFGLRTSAFKDFRTLRAAVAALGERRASRPLLVLAVGDNGPSERLGAAELRFVGRLARPADLVAWYRASDLYVHAARADTFPGAVLEALACGCPVVASAVGGIPEQVAGLAEEELHELAAGPAGEAGGATGALVPPGSPEALARALQVLLARADLRASLSRNAVEDARARFDQRRMLSAYLAWYEELADSATALNAAAEPPPRA